LLLGCILPLKITQEVKQTKERMTIEEAVADLQALGMEPLLALYLKRYPLERDDENRSWAEGIDITLADNPIDVTPPPPKESDTGNDTGNDTCGQAAPILVQTDFWPSRSSTL
jgi:hypothetical protein